MQALAPSAFIKIQMPVIMGKIKKRLVNLVLDRYFNEDLSDYSNLGPLLYLLVR